jgi:antitoxin component of MazEF toxin-antitoxin module
MDAPAHRWIGWRDCRTVERQLTVDDGSDVEAVLGDDQLTAGIDPRQRTRHLAELMDANLAVREARLEQAACENVEPPRRVGRAVVGRPLAEVAALLAQYRCRHMLHVGHGHPVSARA